MARVDAASGDAGGAEAGAAEAGPGLRVTVVFSARAGLVDETALLLAVGATVADALSASGLQQRHPQIDLASLSFGIWGAPCRASQQLRDRDRVELCRPLQVDPMEARRRRQRLQRAAARSAALRRPG